MDECGVWSLLFYTDEDFMVVVFVLIVLMAWRDSLARKFVYSMCIKDNGQESMMAFVSTLVTVHKIYL